MGPVGIGSEAGKGELGELGTEPRMEYAQAAEACNEMGRSQTIQGLVGISKGFGRDGKPLKSFKQRNSRVWLGWKIYEKR